jgi:hypothetical protein
LASTYVTHKIDYPFIPEVEDVTKPFTKGYSTDLTFTVKLKEGLKLAFETKVKSIKLGTKDIEFTDEVSSDGMTMTVTLKATSLTTMTNCTSKPITITFNNGTVDKTSIRLTIQNPSAAGALTITNGTGTNSGTTFTVVTSKATGNTWAYVITPAVIENVNNVDKVLTVAPTATPTTFTTATVDNIAVTAGQYITIFELDATGAIVKYKSILITSSMIKP